jgi:hypothetical protein
MCIFLKKNICRDIFFKKLFSTNIFLKFCHKEVTHGLWSKGLESPSKSHGIGSLPICRLLRLREFLVWRETDSESRGSVFFHLSHKAITHEAGRLSQK